MALVGRSELSDGLGLAATIMGRLVGRMGGTG